MKRNSTFFCKSPDEVWVCAYSIKVCWRRKVLFLHTHYLSLSHYRMGPKRKGGEKEQLRSPCLNGRNSSSTPTQFPSPIHHHRFLFLNLVQKLFTMGKREILGRSFASPSNILTSYMPYLLAKGLKTFGQWIRLLPSTSSF